MAHAMIHQGCLCGRTVRPMASVSRARGSTIVARSGTALPAPFKTVKPVGDRVLVKLAQEESKTAGGILLPSSAQKKATAGDVVSAAADAKDLKLGSKVVYSKYAGTEVTVAGVEHMLLKEDDVIGVLGASGKIGQMQPLQDRILIKNMEAAKKSAGGVLLTTDSAEKPTIGEVIAVGPGKKKEDSDEIIKTTITPGNTVLYSKYSGAEFEDDDETQYIVIREGEVLAVLS